MLNRFCLLSKPRPPVVNGQYQDGWNTNQNQMKNTTFLHCISQLLRVLLKKNLWDTATRSFICFVLHFTPADIIFHRFLELHSTLSEKKIFVTNFPFLTDSLKRIPSTPLTAKIR